MLYLNRSHCTVDDEAVVKEFITVARDSGRLLYFGRVILFFFTVARVSLQR